MKVNKGKEKKAIRINIWAILMLVIACVMGIVYIFQTVINKQKIVLSPENQRAATYEQFEDGDDAIDGTDNVKFSAFFLRDLDGDGYAEKIKGTCREIGTQDTLYMEIIVQTAGQLKNGKININGKNFYMQTTLLKDNEFKNNYIGANIKNIEFEDLNNGTQTHLTGIVKSGDYSYGTRTTEAIGNNINNYSRNDNIITFTGTYVDEEGIETEISKEVPLTVDWYGTTSTVISNVSQTYTNLNSRINSEEGKFTVDFSINTSEKRDQLNIYSNEVEGTIPELNGYAPIEVKQKSGGGVFSYDENTRKFTIIKNAETNEQGDITQSISRNNIYNIQVIYPLEAYQSIGEDTVTIKIPVSTYYEGYNNPNEEFSNPYKSNIAEATIVANFQNPKGTVANIDITVGKFVYSAYSSYIVSKYKPLRIYNGLSSEEKDDTYLVKWHAYTGTDGESTGLILKETENNGETKVDEFLKTGSGKDSMEDITTNVGIYFSGADLLLKQDGEIKVYDEETGVLLATFTKSNWNRYNENNPYRYELPVKHIKVVTSATNREANFYVYNIKELDDEAITTKYTKENFDTLEYIQSNLVGYIGESRIASKTHQAKYVAPYSVANIGLSKNNISTQFTEENMKIYLTTTASLKDNQIGWANGSFIVKLPKEIIDIKINEVTVDKTSVSVDSYELIETEDGKLIKINTSNSNPTSYKITIDADLTPDPRIATVSRNFDLYASNEEGADYYYKAKDIYDVNSNSNTEENVNKTQTSLNLISPNRLLTNQIASEFDNLGTMIISPQIAELRPAYGDETEKSTVKIGVQLKNNYASTISEVLLLGKIPFEGNTYVLSGGNLNSEFTTTMKNSGITVPESLRNSVTVYYSENETPTKDISDATNGWKKKEQVTDWSKIKSYVIDFGDTIIRQGDEYIFYYTIEIPKGLDFNKVAYSHHGIYFCVDTDEGKYPTRTEPSKIGIKTTEKYDLEVIKYQSGKEKLISGATYKVSEVSNEGDILNTVTAVTNEQGKLQINNLYAERIYEIKEIRSPEDYELNQNTIKIIGHVNKNTGILTVEKIEGTIKGEIQTVKEENKDYKVIVKVEDEAKLKLQITKYENNTENKLARIKYKITGDGLPEDGRVSTTGSNGTITLSGLKIGAIYTLEEVKADGYYLGGIVKFKVENNEGTYIAEIIEGTVKSNAVTSTNEIPTLSIELEDEKIPTFNLNIYKIEKGTGVDEIPVKELQGAKFKLYKGTQEIGTYTTNSSGKFTIENLYQYVEGKQIDQTYTLKEIYAPEGYAKVKDISFKVEMQNGELKLISSETSNYTVQGNTVKLTIEDSPSFKLVKKDGETNALLPNVKFAIYNTEDGDSPARNSKGEIIGTKETINGREYYTVTTNSRGEITADLPEGLYKAVEVEADEKYDISTKVKNFGIGKSKDPKKEFQAISGQQFGNTTYELGKEIIETADDGFVIAGHFNSSSVDFGNGVIMNNNNNNNNNCGHDGMIVKFTSEEVARWATAVGGSGWDYFNSVIETSDGYIACGYYRSASIDLGNGQTLSNKVNNNDSSDGMIVKFGQEGQIKWGISVGGDGNDQLNKIIGTSDGGFAVVGYFGSESIDLGNGQMLSNDGNYDMLLKYNAQGVLQWKKNLGGTESNYTESYSSLGIVQLETGDYITFGTFSGNVDFGNGVTLNNETNSTQYMIVKFNSQGTALWAKSVTNTTLRSITACKDGGFLVGGYLNSASANTSLDIGDNIEVISNGDMDGIIIKCNSNGQIQWAENFGGNKSERIDSIKETKDGGFIACGVFYSNSVDFGNGVIINSVKGNNSSSDYDAMIIKFDEKGKAESARCIGGKSTESVNSIIETRNGDFLLTGGFYLDGTSDSISFENDIQFTYKSRNSDAFVLRFKQVEVTDVIKKPVKALDGISAITVNKAIETSDGGCIVIGSISRGIDFGNGIIVNYVDIYDGVVIKINKDEQVEWAKGIGGNSSDGVSSVIETKDGGFLVSGSFASESIDFGNGIKIYNNGFSQQSFNYDGMLVKFSSNGNVEWAKNIGGTDSDGINEVIEKTDGSFIVRGNFLSQYVDLGNGITISKENPPQYESYYMIMKYNERGDIISAKGLGIGDTINQIKDITNSPDGGYLVGAVFRSDSMNFGNGIVVNNNNPNNDAMNSADLLLVKYNSRDEVEWAKGFGGSGTDNLNSVASTKDGGYLIVGQLGTGSAEFGDGITLDSGGIVIKIDSKGKVEWAKNIGNNIRTVIETSDGGYLIEGYFGKGFINFGNDVILDYTGSINSNNGILVKYNANGDAEWAEAFGKQVYSIQEITDGGYLVGSIYQSSGDKQALQKVYAERGVPEQQEVLVENTRKEFKITTDVKEIDGIKGGNISGEDERPYEKVKYGDSSTKEIKMVPDENYEIIGITVNGKEHPYSIAADESYTMPQFDNMKEDKHIVVTYALKDNKITINKKDSITNAPLQGAKFIINEIDERGFPTIMGPEDNGSATTEIETYDEEIGVLGRLISNHENYFFVEKDGKYIPNNGKTYRLENGGTAGVSNSTALSYMEIDLTELQGQYAIVLNSEISSEASCDYGVAFVTDSTDAPNYNTTENRFMYRSGIRPAANYTSKILEGGNKYYLHLEYRKDSGRDKGDDQIVINSIKLYKARQVTRTYNFRTIDRKFVSTNTGRDSTTSNSYFEIDLREYTGKYDIIVNAKISSEENDYGYVKVTDNTTAPSYNSTQGKTIVCISGDEEFEKKVTVEAGSRYYVHMGYYKNEDVSAGDDKFIVNNITAVPNDSELYHAEVVTNSQGKAITQIPFGLYYIKEIEAPEGYVLNNIPQLVSFRSTGGDSHEITFVNEKAVKLNVHHYIKNTTIKVADDEILEGKVGDDYKTNPHFDIPKYELQKDNQGDYVLPSNRNGTYASTNEDVIYYYEPNAIPLTVHHYIEGTETKVPLKNGERAEDVVSYGEENQNYTTTAIPNTQLADDYELIETPENATGKYQYDEVIVTYYYKKVRRTFNFTKYDEDGTTPLSGAVFTLKDGTGNNVLGEYTTGTDGKISIELDAGTYKIQEKTPPETYKLNDAELPIEINRSTETINQRFINEKIKGTVTVHHYIEGTTTPVKLKNGNDASDENKTGDIGEIYVTKPADNVDETYSVVNSSPEHASGEFIDGNIEVIYYYRMTGTRYTVMYYYDGVPKEEYTENKPAPINSTIDEVTPKCDDGYTHQETVGLHLTISENPEENIIRVYYVRRNDLKYTVKYWEKPENETVDPIEISDPKEFTNQTYGTVITSNSSEHMIKIPKYTYDSCDKATLTIGTNNEENIINLYYIKKDANLTIKYLEDGTNNELERSDSQTGKVDDEYTTQPREIEDYILTRNSGNTKGVFTEEPIEVIYYYIHKSKAKVIAKYVDYDTLEEIEDRVIIDGLVDDPYTTPTKDIELYKLVKPLPGNKAGTMTEEPIEVIYYYTQVTAGVLEKHIDEFTEELLDDEIYTGNEGDPYTTESKDFEGYELNENKLPNNATGTMTVEPKEVKYYYNYMTNLTVKHIDRATGDEIIPSSTESKHVGDEYQTNKIEYNEENEETLPFKDYDLVEEPENKTGTMTREPVTVIYYYAKDSAGLEVNYLNIKTNKPVEKQETKDGHIGDDYTTHEKDIEDFDLVTERYPGNATGKLKEEKTVVNYYYIKKAKVTVKYIDKKSGEELTDDIIINGHEGDDYDTEVKSFDGYILEKIPENKEGEIGPEDKTVIYYYLHESAGVIVNHYDIKTGKKLVKEEKIEGYEGKDYETKEIEQQGYALVKERYPENAKGKMKKEVTKVDYYYTQTGKVIVKYKDKNTDEEIEKEEIIEEPIGTPYETEEKKIEKYEIVKEEYPKNTKGDITEEDIEVVYYYKKKTEVISKYIEKETGKEIADKEKIPGYVGDDYKTKDKDIPNYILIEEPKNKEGTMTENTIEVIYYYRKAVFNLSIDKIVKEIQVDGNTKKKNLDIAKYEIRQGKVKDAKVKVVYTIRVTNDGELEGRAVIEENIPKGMTMKEKENKQWNVNGGKATLTTDIIKPGENAEYTVVLTWNNSKSNFGTKKNVVKIVETKNAAGFKETNLKDNKDDAQFIITVKTGAITIVKGVGIATIVLTAIGISILVVRRRTKE